MPAAHPTEGGAMVGPVDATAAAEGSARAFERFGGACALLAGLVNLCYAVMFVVLDNDPASALFLGGAGLVPHPSERFLCMSSLKEHP